MTIAIDLRYINLDRATQRRQLLEKSFAESGFSLRWSLDRIPAVSADSEMVKSRPGTLSGPYKGNFLSHVECLRQSIGRDTHLFVAEDDVQFCTETGPILESIVDQLPEDSWDVIRTEVTMQSALDFSWLYKLSANRVGMSTVRLLELGGLHYGFTGSSAYIVNRRSKETLVRVTENLIQRVAGGELNLPFDYCLKEIFRLRVMKGFLTVPFLTAPSVHADESQAPTTYAESEGKTDADSEAQHNRLINQVFLQLLTAFRRLIWVGYKPEDVLSPLLARNDLMAMSERDRLLQKILPSMLMLQLNIGYVSDADKLLNFLPLEIPRSPAG